MKSIALRSTLALLCCFALSVHAQESIKVGMVLPLTGPLAATGNDIVLGTKAAIDSINRAGGIKGQKIELIIEDDRFDAKLSEELSREMAKNKGVTAFLSCFGTVSCLSLAKVAQETGVPLLGPMAGSEALRADKQTKVYSIRANAREEVGALLHYLSGIKQNNAAVVVQDDGFGKAYASSLQAIASKYDFKPSIEIVFDPKAPNYLDIAKRLSAGNAAPAVLLIANTVHSVGIIKALNDMKYYGQVLNLAGQANGGFIKGLAKVTQLSVFATVTPSPFGESSPAAQAFRDHWKLSAGHGNYSYIGFEAYINAQMLGVALKRSTAFSAKAIDLALSQLSKAKFNELSYTFAGNNRQGASYTDLAVLSNGTFLH